MKLRLFLLYLFTCFACSLSYGSNPERVLVIGGDYNYPPYEYLNEVGEPEGYNVDLSKAICQKLGYQPKFKLAKWSLVRGWLDDGSIDLVQGMAFSVARAQILHFSTAHTMTWRAIFVPKNTSIRSQADILSKSVVVQKDDIATDYLKQVNFRGTLSEVPTQEDALRYLNSGDFDASVLNYMMGKYIIRKEKLNNVKALPQRIHQREYCYASNDEDLIKQIDNVIIQLSQTGELIRLQDKWFGELEFTPEKRSMIISLMMYIGLPLLLLCFVMIYFYGKTIKELRQKGRELNDQLAKTELAEQELRNEFSVFIKGPVVVFKLRHPDLTPLRLSENFLMWGYSLEEMILNQDAFSIIVFPDDKERFERHYAEMTTNNPTLLQHRIVTKSGEVRWVLAYTILINDEKTGEGFFHGYVLDITDQKDLETQLLEQKERAEAANISKSHFLANMSHEIRSPLNGITGFLQVLMQMDATDQQREFYDIMYSSSKNLMKIINDILDFSKIESGKMDLILSEFNLKFLLDDLIKQFQYQEREKDIVLRTSVSDSIPDLVIGDQLRLKQILINMLQNAVKFTEEGFVELGAEIYTISNTDVRVLFRVADSGIGIDPIRQQDIFDNYTQAESYITSKYGGTGLGLSIVKRLVELMHGFIWVESEQGKGSCFYVIMPFRRLSEVPDTDFADIHPEITFADLPVQNVLLVEDESINQVVTRHQLESWKQKVSIANNGLEAIQMHSKHAYDIILMDIQMPVMDGITATKKIREMERQSNVHTPIIAYTAAALVGDRERFIASGMDDCITKPVDMNLLHEIVRKYSKE